jgi:tricorn protease-like protein
LVSSFEFRSSSLIRAFGIWDFDVASSQTTAVNIRLHGTAAEPTAEQANYTTGFSERAVSHDGKKLAVVTRGQVLATTAAGGNAIRVRHIDAIESNLAWDKEERYRTISLSQDLHRRLTR